ncbi:hypothetical protein ACQR35_06830 [Pseudarthrobacter sp. J1738]|uniref:hypothetical protein n=1 Tax=unclassified Pseudarthrobacter TaxID=2647000 RepID=UPI003D2E6D8E
MNPRPVSPTAKDVQLGRTQQYFRFFLICVLGTFFVFQLSVDYVALSALLALIGVVLGVVVIVRTVRAKQSKFLIFGAVSGIVVCGISLLLALFCVFAFDQVKTLQECSKSALTLHAAQQCTTDFETSIIGVKR